MKTFAISLVSSVCVIAALASSQTSRAQTVPVLFQTTFNCPEWLQTVSMRSDAFVCNPTDGISGNGDWFTSNGSRDQITAAANNPAGGGGKGFRHWVGDGTNNAGGGIVVEWTPTSEMWMRYYIRFQQGFRWNFNVVTPNMKTIYCNRNEPGTFYFGLHDGIIGGHVELGENPHSSVTWQQWQGSLLGDGTFHVLEVHVKMNTSGASSDGIFEFWADGTRIYTNSAVRFANTSGARFSNCAFGENHNYPENGGVDVYVDFDDIVVSTTGYIGPIGSPGPGPAAPKNLRVQ